MPLTLAPATGEQRFEHGKPRDSGSAHVCELRLSSALKERLSCPVCGACLDVNQQDCSCLDVACGKQFRVVRGVPILIDEDASVFSLRQALSRCAPMDATLPGPFVKWLRERLPALSANPVAARNVDRLRRLLLESNPQPCVLVIGAAWVGAGMEELLGDPRIECVESDVWLSDRTHLVCDAHQIPFEGETFDGVVIQAVLEHVADPERCVREVRRVLKPDGLVYAETAFLQQVHAGRHDFARFTPVGHRRLFRGFEQIAAGAAAGPAVALAWSWQHFLLSFTTTRAGRAAATAAGACTAFWLKYLDRFLLETPAALDAASACFFLGARQEHELTDREVVAAYPGAQHDVV